MFYFGVDYYPEQWPEERWKIDAQLMSEAGFNVVRLAEFAWSKMEPVEGKFRFDWLDRVISILRAVNIQVILGTPTASPPPWLMSKSAEFFLVREDGVRATYGNRREYCPNQPVYQNYCQRIVRRMAEHYGNHPSVIGWQIDNELGERCYCPNCAQQFQTWLRSRYASLEELNQKWGTVFWSHCYNDWSEIPVPLKSGGSPNPGLALDYYRFCSDSYIAFQQQQIDILRDYSPGKVITHNLMGFGFDKLDYFNFARELDVVGYDNYPRSQWSFAEAVDPSELALSHATMRGLKRKNFWVMEQQAGSGGWEVISVTPRPGEMRLWAYQAIAHGADALLFFRWRTARYGIEQYWHGLLDHDAQPGRRYQEIKRMGLEIKTIGDQIAGSVVKSQVAMLLSYDSRFTFRIQPNHPDFSYDRHFLELYRAFHQGNIPVDICSPHADLSAYAVVIAPALHLLSEAEAGNLEQYVAGGGILLVTQRSGVKDECNAVVDRRLPGLLSEVCGVEVDEYDSLHCNMHNAVRFTKVGSDGRADYPVGILCDILRPTSAEVVAVYTQDYYAGRPAITLNRFGKGHAVYVGALGNCQLYGALAGWLMELTGQRPCIEAPQGIEISERWQGDRRLIFVLNHSNCPQEVTLERKYIDLVSGKTLAGNVSLPPKEVLILSDNLNAFSPGDGATGQ